jgi:hypothetical protein
MRTTQEIKFMMRKCLHLMISDVRHTSKIYQGIIEFKPKGNFRSHNATSIEFKKLSLFLNLWAAVDFLHEYILHDIEVPFVWGNTYKKCKEMQNEGFIDWALTINHWGGGAKEEFIVRSRDKKVATDQIEIIKFILLEVMVHAEVIISEFDFYINKNLSRIYEKMREDIEKTCKSILNIINLKFDEHYTVSAQPAYSSIKSELKSIIEDVNNSGPGIFKEYSKTNELRVKGYYFNDCVSNLMTWRNQYLECRIWLSEELGFSLHQKSHKDRLYELFCFVELANAFGRARIGSTTQKSFISHKRKSPEFKMGSDHFVYYDNRLNKFKKCDASGVFDENITNDVPAIKNIFVEWFIQNVNDFKDSIVVDAKNGRWASREVLKVVGYMLSYGINKSVIIFKYKVNHINIGGELLGDDIIRITFPGSENKRLWIIRLVPLENYENQNRLVLDKLVKEIF